MSLDSWKAEFYPTPAKECDRANAAAHSLRKWQGLRKENLARHQLKASGSALFAADVTDFMNARAEMYVDGCSCALCECYHDNNSTSYETACENCPLTKVLGHKCDDRESAEISPYFKFVSEEDPEPMIAALEQVLQLHKELDDDDIGATE